MTETEWLCSGDASPMLDFLWQPQGVSPHWTNLRFGGDVRERSVPQDTAADLDRALHRFYLGDRCSS